MTETNEKWIIRRNQLKFSYEALYRDVAACFGMSCTAVWVLYTLMDADGALVQQDLREKWNFPKQTVNSAIQALQKKGYLTLTGIPGTRNRKLIRLTEAGKALVEQTTRRLAQAEERAAAHLTEEERTQYLALSAKFYHALRDETASLRTGTEA